MTDKMAWNGALARAEATRCDLERRQELLRQARAEHGYVLRHRRRAEDGDSPEKTMWGAGVDRAFEALERFEEIEKRFAELVAQEPLRTVPSPATRDSPSHWRPREKPIDVVDAEFREIL